MYPRLYYILLLLWLVLDVTAGISVTNKTSSPIDVVVRYPQWVRSKITQVYPNKTATIADVNQLAQVQVLDDWEQPRAEAWLNPLDKTVVTTNAAIAVSEDKGKMQVKIQ